jgi:MOSC domain-containing protein
VISYIQSLTAARFLTAAELAAGLPDILRSPTDGGTVEMIVARPDSEQRCLLEHGVLAPATGLQGDRWQATCGLKLPDGSPDPAVQITLMNSRCIQLLTENRELWPLAGDNFFVDLDLSIENLPVGSRLRLGSCVLQISQPPHTGCAKFKRRFGLAALEFVNSPEGKAQRLRGVNASVAQPGEVKVGDRIERYA